MNNLIALLLSAGGAAFITALITGLRSVGAARYEQQEAMIQRLANQNELLQGNRSIEKTPEEPGNPDIRAHVREKAERRLQELADWDAEFQNVDPRPSQPTRDDTGSPVTWGDWTVGYSNNCRIGMETGVAGSVITVSYYVDFQYSTYDSVTLVMTGSIRGNYPVEYHHSGGPLKVKTLTGTGVPGSWSAFNVELQNVYSGANPSVSSLVYVPVALDIHHKVW